MRKYYWDLIQDNTYYRRTMRNVKLKHKMLISCSNEITEKFMSTSEMRSTTFILASIAFPNDMKKILKLSWEEKKNSMEIVNEALEKISTIEWAMNKFSMKNLSKFLEIYEVPILLMNYLSKVQNSEYIYYYTMLQEMAEKAIKWRPVVVPVSSSLVNLIF